MTFENGLFHDLSVLPDSSDILFIKHLVLVCHGVPSFLIRSISLPKMTSETGHFAISFNLDGVHEMKSPQDRDDVETQNLLRKHFYCISNHLPVRSMLSFKLASEHR